MENILDKYNKNNLYPKETPRNINKKLYNNNKQVTTKEILIYQRYIGSLLYLALKTRPDIAFLVQYCTRY